MAKVSGGGGAGQEAGAAAECSCAERMRSAREELEEIESELMVVSVAAGDGAVDIHDDVSAVCLRIHERVRAVRKGLEGTW